MPQPQLALLVIGVFEVTRVDDHLGCQNRGDMLDAHGRCQLEDFRPCANPVDHARNVLFEPRDIEITTAQMLVETKMFATVRGFLLDEGANFSLQPRRDATEKFLQSIDEEYFALRKGGRQRVEKSRGKRVTADPPATFDQRTGKMPGSLAVSAMDEFLAIFVAKPS